MAKFKVSEFVSEYLGPSIMVALVLPVIVFLWRWALS